MVTIPEILKLEGTKLIIVGASHVPAIMMEIKEQTVQKEHEMDLVRLGSDFK